MVDGLPPSSTNSYIFSNNMSHEQVIQAAKDAGADEKTLENLKEVLKNDTDKIVTNSVEAEMLQSIFNPKYRMNNVTDQNGIKTNHHDEGIIQYGYLDKKDVLHISDYFDTENSQCTRNESFFFDKDSMTEYTLRDVDGDGKPDTYKEIKFGENFSVKEYARKVFPGLFRH